MKKKTIIGLFLVLIGLSYFGYAFKISFQEEEILYHPKKVFSHAPEQYALKAQDVFFEAPDHLRLHGWFFESKKTQKTLLFFHGNGGNVASNLELISIFVQKVHLNVFVIDYRGFGKSEGHPSETGLYQDAEAAYEYLTQVRKMDKDNIIIFGQSLGGAIAIDLASKRPASVLIVENTFTSAVAMAKVFYPYLPVRLFIKSKFDSLEKMKSIAMPKLIIHATEDETVPFQLGKKLFEVAATPKEFYAVLGAHHGNNYATGGPSYVEKLKKFTKVF